MRITASARSRCDCAAQLTPQARLTALLASLDHCQALLASLALLSSNETLEDLATSTLPCLLVPFLQGQCSLHRRTTGTRARRAVLDAAVERFDAFFRSLDDYSVVAKGAAGEPEPRDPTQRRAVKIAAFKAERELKSRIEVRRRIAN